MHIFSDTATLIIYLIEIFEDMEKDVRIKIYTDWKEPNYTAVRSDE